MCGIAGLVGNLPQDARARVARMVAAMQHRGPDGHGLHCDDGCILGHTRLAIVAPAAGEQPMRSAVSNKRIVFNGEIYGFRDTLAKLHTDYPFATQSDTEVILATYEKFGSDCPAHINGMFAFALWDPEHREAFLARDRFGEKPLYYAFANGTLVFASELKSLLACGLIDPEIDPHALAHFLKFLYVQPDRTIYRNVNILPPAHSMRFRDGTLRIERYWQLPSERSGITLDEAAETFRYLFSRAVKNQLVADVPVGCFLSGGLDSSTVVAVASEHCSHLQTFSLDVGGAASEAAYARKVAQRYGTNHHEYVLEDVDLAELMLHMGHIYDEPFADSSCILTYLIAKYASKEIKVVLSGDGADELLGGYDWWYRPLLKAPPLNPATALQAVVGLLHAGRDKRPVRHSVHARYQGKAGVFSDLEISTLLHGTARAPAYCSTDESSNMNDVNVAMRMDLGNYLPGDILVKTDRASMAHSLELRAPFLDTELATFCISLPSSLKISDKQTKILLREAYGQAWPSAVQTRRKQGFGADVSSWLKRADVIALVDYYLRDRRRVIFDGLICFDAVQDALAFSGYRVWTLLTLSIWAERRELALGGKQ